MLFNSYIFLFAFLPITLVVYWGLRGFGATRLSMCALIIASLVFYSYQDLGFGVLLLLSVLVNYLLHRLLTGKLGEITWVSILILVAGCLYNLGILFYFKYLGFFLENFNALTGQEILSEGVILPLGISFYTFQQLSTIVDSYKGNIERYSLIEYALFVSFFPQLIAGPIVLHSEMVPQFRKMEEKKPRLENMYDGSQYFILGLAKKLLIADVLGRGVDWGYDNILWLNSFSAIVLILLYTLQIYFDFSGYCDMAIGLGRMFGFNIAINFNSPYKSLSVSEFWKRWHITLTRFFTTYVYIPLGGNRKGMARTCINVFIVFALSGLWHGAAWTFVVWGIMHGIMMVVERLMGRERLNKIPKIIRFIYTFGFVNCAWVFFRAPDFTDALNIFKRILHGGSGYILDGMAEAIMGSGLSAKAGSVILPAQAVTTTLPAQIVSTFMIILALYMAIGHKNTAEIVSKRCIKTVYAIGVGVLFLFAVVAISGVSTFLYFNF